MTFDLVCIPPSTAEFVWKICEDILRPALIDTHADFGIVAEDVCAGRSLLWVVRKNAEIVAAAVTSLAIANGRKFCTIVACGGRGLVDWQHFIERLEQFAKDENCRSIVIMGRRGWLRQLAGYKAVSTTIEKELK
jgi:hypothetical protein